MQSHTTGSIGFSTRGGLPVKLTLEGDRRAELRGQVVAFDRFWMRINLGESQAIPAEGSNLGLDLVDRHAEPPLHVNGIVWRAHGNGLITVLLSLTGQEFNRLKGLVTAPPHPRLVPPPTVPGLVSSPPQVQAPPSWRRARARSPVITPVPELEGPARSTEPGVKSNGRGGSASEREARRTSGPEPAGRPSPAEEAARLAARGDHEEAARRYSEALHAAPEDVSLWYALGTALHHLSRWREATEAFEYVVRHGPPDSREVHFARVWLERGRTTEEPADEARAETRIASVEPGPQPSEAPPRAEPSEASLPQQAAMLEARGEPRKAAKLYYQALHQSPHDASLWYALGAIMHRLNRSKAAARAFEKVVQYGPRESREVELARLWLEGRQVPAEPTAPGIRARPRAQGQTGPSGTPPEPHAEPSVANASSESKRSIPPVEARPARSSSSRPAVPPAAAAGGDFEGAARLYYEPFQQALGASPDDALLWYALGVTLQHLNRTQAAARAFDKVLQHARPGSREARLARLWLELGEAAIGPVGGVVLDGKPSGAGAALKPETPGVKPDAKALTPSPATRPGETAAPSVGASLEPEKPAASTEPRPRSSGRAAASRKQPSPPPADADAETDPWELGSAFERDMPVPPIETRSKARPASPAVDRPEPEGSAAPDLGRSSRPEPEGEARAPSGGPRAKASSRSPVPQRGAHRPAGSGRTKSSATSPAEEAAILVARGDWEGAAHHYSEALRAAPEDVSLWYALGMTLHRLRRRAEAAEAFEYVVRHGRSGSREVRLARVWLERGGIRQ